MKLTLSSDAPISAGPRRISVEERRIIQGIVKELLESGCIRPSTSPYTSPVLLVKKKNGDPRMCIDYRALNRLTIRDIYPLPLIDDCLLYLANKRYFSLIDLKSAFNQVSVDEESIKYTSFVTPVGQYEHLVMPFGLKNAPAVFQ